MEMKMQRRFNRATMIIATFLLALLLSGCGDEKKETEAVGQQGKAVAVKIGDDSSATPLSTSKSSIGEIVVGLNDHTVYTFDREPGESLDCSGKCAWTWLPVLTSKGVRISGGVEKDKVGAVEFSDSGDQVTYAGHPLYFYTGSTDPGNVDGNGLETAGVRWYTLSPDGELNRKQPPSPATGK